jgi:hypothetical protein
MMSEIANLEGQQQLPQSYLIAERANFLPGAKRTRLDEQSGFGKAHLKLLVNENELWEKASIRGGDGAQSRALARRKWDT